MKLFCFPQPAARNTPHKGQQRKRFRRLRCHLDGAEIDDFLSGRVGDALVSERRDSQSDQYDRNYDFWVSSNLPFLCLSMSR